jgi:hypothetical protein
MSYSPEILAEIRAEMGRKKVGVGELSRRTGIPQTRLHRRFHRGVPLSTDELVAIATALNTTASQILARAESAA